jgi:acetyltransferase EpsM
MAKNIIILGGLGNGSIIANAIEHANSMGFDEWIFKGYLNDRIPVGELIEKYPVVGELSDVSFFLENENNYFINTILRIDGQKERLKLLKNLKIPEDRMATFVHPSAYVAPTVQLSPGTVIMPNVSLSPGTIFGKSCLVMVGAMVGHDNVIGDFCHIAAQATVGSYLKIGKGVHIGLNATIRENLSIGNYATVGMGAVLTKDVKESEIWVGNPAKFLRIAK